MTQTPPLTILMIRHGEKPISGALPNGITADGSVSDHSLTVRGWQRAGALVAFFSQPGTGLVPNTVFAASGSLGTHGLRSRETVMPLVAKLGNSISTRFDLGVGQERDVAEAILGCSGTVLVAWEHHNLPVIASHFPLNPTEPPVPAYPDNRFDLVWRFDYDIAISAYRWRQTPQLLLAGDLPV